MCSESRLLQVKLGQHETIGFLFVYVENESDAHIGYLLAEEHWGKGYASELLQGFIHAVTSIEYWSTNCGSGAIQPCFHSVAQKAGVFTASA